MASLRFAVKIEDIAYRHTTPPFFYWMKKCYLCGYICLACRTDWPLRQSWGLSYLWNFTVNCALKRVPTFL